MNHQPTTNPFQARREQLRKTKTQLAREVGVSVTVVWQWEHDRQVPRLNRIEDLVTAYETDLRTMKDWLAQQMLRVLGHRMERGAA